MKWRYRFHRVTREKRNDEAVCYPHTSRHCEEQSDKAIYYLIPVRLPRFARDDGKKAIARTIKRTLCQKPLRSCGAPPLAGEALGHCMPRS